ncbi:virulence associated lipoprotein [Borreliella kurtenbachii]|uniref:virulence associated lipoprotein n=1 Tax=Borreliella kurtenbachii TaxID=1196056 RepID=UPI00265B2A11|nr:virulence associated lipoprotein [Borreliella kurtenbachii]WKC86714.1 virulence associated lipoprotein [Borreliella kurtenbachii]
MKYKIIAGLFVFLFLACNTDFNTKAKDMKYQSSKKRLKSKKKGLKPKTEANLIQKEGLNQEESSANQKKDRDTDPKNTLLNALRNSIDKAHANNEKYEKKLKEEPKEQYGIEAFKTLGWSSSPGEKVAADTERAKRYRKNTYSILNTINDNQLKEFSEIVMLSGQIQGIFNTIEAIEYTLSSLIVPSLYSKKGNLEKLEISNLEKLKDSFEKVLSIKTTISKMMHQLLLDYQNDTNHIKTDNNKLKSHADTLYNQISEKKKKVEKLKDDIFLIINNI